MLNVKNLINGKHKRKDFQLPYNSISDSRLNVSMLEVYLKPLLLQKKKEDFLKYIDDWESGAMNRKEFTVAQKYKLLLD